MPCPNPCVMCRYLVADKVNSLCAAPQLAHLAELVAGVDMPGAAMPALQARLNQSLCGTPGYWFAGDPAGMAPPAPAEPSKKPRVAAARRRKRR